MKFIRQFFVLGALLFCTVSYATDVPEDYVTAKRAFINEISAKHDVDKKWLAELMAKAKYRQSIINAMNRPAEGVLTWKKYRKIFLTKKRIKGGVKFMRENAAILERAQKAYGVPAEIITAIIGVETYYGGNAGSYPVIDALSTLGFAYPKRAKFFRKQLEQYILLVGEENLDAAKIKGSYAGAMGMPQFIPSSYRDFAVDFDGDGQRDLLNNKEDIIGSVAAYFSKHHWQSGRQIATPAIGVKASHQAFIDAGMKPSITVGQLQTVGIKSKAPLNPKATTSLIKFEGEKGTEHWFGLDNFYVITRYNHSNLYAMAVYQLSQEIMSLKRRSSKH